MKREIKFRGKNKNNVWVYGHLSYSDNEDIYYIGVEELKMQVNPNTVGQLLFDDFYEGDLVLLPNYLQPTKGGRTACVEVNNGFIKLVATDNQAKYGRGHLYGKAIGNIHEQ